MITNKYGKHTFKHLPDITEFVVSCIMYHGFVWLVPILNTVDLEDSEFVFD